MVLAEDVILEQAWAPRMVQRLTPRFRNFVGFRRLGFRVQGLGFRVQGLGFRIQGLGFRVQGLGFRVQGLGFGVQGLGCRVWGSGLVDVIVVAMFGALSVRTTALCHEVQRMCGRVLTLNCLKQNENACSSRCLSGGTSMRAIVWNRFGSGQMDEKNFQQVKSLNAILSALLHP